MEPGKKSNNSEASSTNADQDDDYQVPVDQEEKPKEESAVVGKSYECTFCKRGFTNAQALGGHMNIHRKDKAKAKASKHNKNIHDLEPAASFMDKSIKYSGYFPGELISSHHPDGQNLSAAGYYQLINNYQVYLQPSRPNPSPQTGSDTYPVINSRVSALDRFGDDVDVDGNQLSLRIGLTTSSGTSNSPPAVEEQNVKENEELDLELRLGHDP